MERIFHGRMAQICKRMNIYIYIKKNKKENMETLTKGLTITNVVFNSKL